MLLFFGVSFFLFLLRVSSKPIHHRRCSADRGSPLSHFVNNAYFHRAYPVSRRFSVVGGEGCFLSFFPSFPFFFERERKTAFTKIRREEKSPSLDSLSPCLLLAPHSKMDATAAGAAAPGPSGSAPRLRVDELLDDVANSVRRERIEMAPASPSARIAFFFSVVSGAQAFSPCSLFLSLSLRFQLPRRRRRYISFCQSAN